jgi:outer membrane lipoprotein-sorting protein
MSILTSRPATRWLAPVAVAAAVFGVGAGVNALTASAAPSLPARSAAQLLVDLQTARLDGMSGTVVQKADLGLPALPSIGGQGSSDLTSLISGSHTLRVWYAGPHSARIALIGTLGESDIITNGKDLWLWDSRANTATHRTLGLGAESGKPDRAPLDPNRLPKTPQEAADLALAAISPSTIVTTGSAGRVAGRDAYELILAPRDTASLVSQVRLAIDANQHIPLRVQVYARNVDAPAFEVKFTSVSFKRPDAAQFTFTPPPGAKIVEQSADGKSGDTKSGNATTPKDDATSRRPQMALVGKGWTTVLVARLPQGTTAPSTDADAAGKGDRGNPLSLLGALPAVSGSWGTGHLLTSKLFSVLITDDGRVLIGAVSSQRLQEAAADPAAALKAPTK